MVITLLLLWAGDAVGLRLGGGLASYVGASAAGFGRVLAEPPTLVDLLLGMLPPRGV